MNGESQAGQGRGQLSEGLEPRGALQDAPQHRLEIGLDDPDLMAIERDLALLVRGLECLYRRRGYPIERAQYLLLLKLAEGARSTGDLAETLGIDHSTATRQISGLERIGFATRREHPEDRRSALIEATEAGRAACAQMRQTRLQRLGGMISDWDDSERADFARLVGRLNVAIRDVANSDEEADAAAKSLPSASRPAMVLGQQAGARRG